MTITHSAGQYEISFSKFQPNGEIVITDANVIEIYPVLKSLDPIIVPAGEQSKNITMYSDICDLLVKRKVNRKSTLVAFGGGVIGDLVGFIAATYMRGIRYIQVPTTLLSQVDSSVGGKVGVDLPSGKNLVGAFYPPQKVIVDTEYLKTLPQREIQCGIAEVVKYGWIMDPSLLFNRNYNNLPDVVKRCIELKAKVVMEDEFEIYGVRAWLNFGHTLGHVYEQLTGYSKYTHGEAISMGMVAETKIAAKLGICSSDLIVQVAESLSLHGLPTETPQFSFQDVIDVALRDKKSLDGSLTMSLVSSAGKCQLVKGIPASLIEEVHPK